MFSSYVFVFTVASVTALILMTIVAVPIWLSQETTSIPRIVVFKGLGFCGGIGGGGGGGLRR